MPCDEIRTSTISLKNADRELLQRALEAEGFTVAVNAESLVFTRFTAALGRVAGSYDGRKLDIVTQEFRDVSGPEVVNAIKRRYAAQVVQAACRRFGWRLTQKAPDRFVGQRRG